MGPVQTTALALYAGAAAQSGCTEAAAILYELLEPWSDQLAVSGALNYGHMRMYLGQLADAAGWPERADAHLDFATRLHDENGMRLLAADSRLAWATSFARRGDCPRGAGAGRSGHGARHRQRLRRNREAGGRANERGSLGRNLTRRSLSSSGPKSWDAASRARLLGSSPTGQPRPNFPSPRASGSLQPSPLQAQSRSPGSAARASAFTI